MIKHLEIKTYEYGDVKVTVQINYDLNTISLIEMCDIPHLHDPQYNKSCYSKPHHYVFANRGLEYMNGWRNVLHGLEHAIGEAEAELKAYIKQKEDEKHELVENVLMQATDIVKARSLPCERHKLTGCKSKKCRK